MSKGKLAAVAIAMTSGLLLQGISSAATTSSSPTPPTTDGADIAELTGTDTYPDDNNGGVWGNRPAQGQTFLTLSNAGGYTLSAITVREPNSDGPSAATIRIGTITGTPGSLTFNGVYSQVSDAAAAVVNDYRTFTLSPAVHLEPNTVYGFDLHGNDGAGFRVYNHFDSSSGGNLYADGVAYSASGSTDVSTYAADRVFHLDLATVPEPASALTLAAIAGMGIGRRSRR